MSPASPDSSEAPPLHPPGWPVSLGVAAVATAGFTWPAWPGHMSYDSLFAYKQSIYGVQTMLWPPLHSYLFFLSRVLGAGTWGLYLAQTVLLFASAGVVIHLLIRSRRLAAGLTVLFPLLMLYVPTLGGAVLAQWRDVPTAGFALLAVALWLMGAWSRSRPLLVAALFAAAGALALRYNAVALVFALAALVVWRPFLRPRPSPADRLVAGAALVVAFGLAWASTQWRLPDLVHLPPPDNFGGTQEFDLIGVSACADEDLLPAAVTAGVPITPYQIRRAYDPRHLQLALQPHPGAPTLLETGADGEVAANWAFAVRHYPLCYLDHRLQVFVEQMGMADHTPFYVAHGGIDANPFGLRLAHPAASDALVRYLEQAAPHLWRRPFWLYLAALVLAGALLARRRDAPAQVLAALTLGAFAYPGLLAIAAPAADARYIFPSNIFCALVALVAAGLIYEDTARRRSLEAAHG